MSISAGAGSDLDRGWSWIVMLASFGSMFITGGMNFSVGLIHATLLERYSAGQSATSWVGALHTAIMNLAAPLSSLVVDNYSVRAAVVASGVLFTAGYLGTAFAPTLGLTVFTCGIVAGLGGALGWTAAMLAPGLHFSRYRNLAIGFSMTGNAVGLLGTAPAVQAAREVYGTSGFFIVLAAISVHQVVFGVLMKPSSLERSIKRDRSLQNKRSDTSKRRNFSSVLSGYFKVCTTLSVSVLSLSFLFIGMANYSLFIHLPNFCTYSGHSEMEASYLLSAAGVSSILGRLITGAAANLRHVDEMHVHSGTMLGLGVAACLAPLYATSYPGQLGLAVMLGFFFGTPYVTATPINIRLVGLPNMAAALGNELFLGGVGAIIGPVLTSFLLDRGLTYLNIFVISGILHILAACLGVLAVVIAKSTRCGTGFKDTGQDEIVVPPPRETEKMIE